MSKHDIADFQTQVLARSQEVPVLCDFWAPWCAPCRMLGPVLENLAQDAAGLWELAKLNVDDHQAVAAQYRISGIPAVKLFSKGEVVAEFTGAMGERQLKEWLDANLPGGTPSPWGEIEEALADLRFDRALELLQSPEIPREPIRDFLMARAILWSDPVQALGLLGGKAPVDVEERVWEAAKFLALLLAKDPPSGGETPHDQTFAEALALLRKGDLAPAMGLLSSILIEKPRFRDGAAVDVQRALLRLLGLRHPLSSQHYSVWSGAASLQ